MPRTRRAAAAGAILLLLAGCVSYQEVKEMPVGAEKVVPGVPADPLSSCVMEASIGQDANVALHRRHDVIRKKWFITAEFTSLFGGGEGVYDYSIAFEDTPAGTKMEIRSLKDMWGNLQAPVDQIFATAEDCRAALSGQDKAPNGGGAK